MAKPTEDQLKDFRATLNNLKKTGDITHKELVQGYNAYESGLISKGGVLRKFGIGNQMSEDEYKSKTDLRNQKTFGEGRTLDKKKGGKAKKMMGGGKVHSKYTSGNKRYANGGKIYPKMGK